MIKKIINKILDIIDKFVPDAETKQKIKAALIEHSAELEKDFMAWGRSVDEGQVKLNLADAAKNFFHGGWRPTLAWVCVIAWTYDVIIYDKLNYVLVNIYYLPPLEAMDSDKLNTMLIYLLGFGAYRTYEKRKGIAKGIRHIGAVVQGAINKRSGAGG